MLVENDEYHNDEDKAFTIDLAATGRATCRTCDEVISKQTLRVSHVPLFRGKPGYRVYRHLQCAVFPEEVRTTRDVSGWRNLTRADLKLLEERIEESKILIAKENEELQPDELVQVEFQGEIRKAPPGLAGVNLLPFQIEGASWMYHQERHCEDIRGGILADEMGMGKTVQTIVTILDNRPKLQHSKPGAKHPPRCPDVQDRQREEGLWSNALQEWKNEMIMNNVSSSAISRKPAVRAGTLVICPLVALSQWKAEIEKFTKPSTLSVCVYHGTDRASETPLEMLQKYDVVLTTFQVLEQDFRKMVSPNKVACPNCNAKFKIDKLRVHLKYFCGENAQRTEAQARQRRANERNVQPSSSSKGKNKGKSGSKKKPMKKFASTDLDSDDDLSNVEDILKNASSCRPCRSAAKTATRKVSASVQQWKDTVASDSSYNSESEEDVDDDSEDDTPPPQKQAGRGKSKNDLEKARKKQEMALQNAKKSSMKKTVEKKGKKSFPKMNRKFDESDDDSDDAAPESVDPLEGIDLDLLMEEAMAGSKQSPLHSVIWWRVILDEAHFIKVGLLLCY
jgi:DNA repair protein RAD16